LTNATHFKTKARFLNRMLVLLLSVL